MKSALWNVVQCARRNVDATVSSESTPFLKLVDMARPSIACIRSLAGRTLHYANCMPILRRNPVEPVVGDLVAGRPRDVGEGMSASDEVDLRQAVTRWPAASATELADQGFAALTGVTVMVPARLITSTPGFRGRP